MITPDKGDIAMSQQQQRLIARYLACYALFTTVIALSILVIFGIWRNTITMLVVRYVEKPWAYNAYQSFGLIALTILGFILVMTAEPYLRDGVARKQLMKRFGKL